MKRVLIGLCFVMVAGAGALAQSMLRQETASLDPIQRGVVYEASFCGGTGSFGVRFDMRVTKLLNDHWFEADYGYLDKDTGEISRPSAARFNLTELCYVKPILP